MGNCESRITTAAAEGATTSGSEKLDFHHNINLNNNHILPTSPTLAITTQPPLPPIKKVAATIVAAGEGSPTTKKKTKSTKKMTLSLRDQNKRNRSINHELENEKKLRDSTVKLLLLGAGESGKSTILKQMKIIHDNGFTDDEILSKRNMVYANVLQSVRAVLEGMFKLDLPLGSEKARKMANVINDIVLSNREAAPIPDDIYDGIKVLLADKGFQAAIQRRGSFYLPDSALYFIENVDRICDAQYIPTQQDILLLRVATLGVIEVKFMIKNKIWRVFDVGGQRSQRKKWIHCFDDVTSVIFVSALSEYDQVLVEDNSTNRMRESLQLFEQVCNNKYFVDTGIILFLNKKDLFAEKIGKTTSIKVAFPSYNGPEAYEPCAKYIERQFFMANKVPNKSIYSHQTCATDTKQVQFVLDSVLDTILSTKLKGCGM